MPVTPHQIKEELKWAQEWAQTQGIVSDPVVLDAMDPEVKDLYDKLIVGSKKISSLPNWANRPSDIRSQVWLDDNEYQFINLIIYGGSEEYGEEQDLEFIIISQSTVDLFLTEPWEYLLKDF